MLFIIFIIAMGGIGFALFMTGAEDFDDKLYNIGGIMLIISIILVIFGFFHGYIDYPPTKGTHQGIVTAVDLEGIYFRHYKVYLKSSAYTEQGDETEYCVYIDETKLVEELQNAIGKKAKLHYSHKGGYTGWKSCGTYHIDSVELIEE